ncbi:hypothetical protein [Streptomyces sp. NPDC059863]|uniref:hypothetical protein n=1 Tax=unclassified Streptomyces TaxID=2593676 RepID=UPI00365AE0BD
MPTIVEPGDGENVDIVEVSEEGRATLARVDTSSEHLPRGHRRACRTGGSALRWL